MGREYVFHINEVRIEGFWNKFRVEAKLNPDVNIFIGKNGTGKTTFINILQSVLTVDLGLMEDLQFHEVRIRLSSKGRSRTISVVREAGEFPFEMLRYKVSTRMYEMPMVTRESEPRYRRVHPRYVRSLTTLRTEMDKLINISWLPLHREVIEQSMKDEHRMMTYPHKSPIDHRLKELIEKFTRYQLRLEAETGKVSKRFQKDVLISMLYDENLDAFDLQSVSDIDLGKEKEGLIRAYEELGATGKSARKRIDDHFKTLRRSLKELRDGFGEGGIGLDKIFSLPHLKRTQYTVNLSRKSEDEKKKIFDPMNRFLEMLHAFAVDKEFTLGAGGELLVRTKKEKKELSIEQLSSGEKQLIVFLTETLLQKNEPFTFIADEPELSLHIEWQERIIESIRQLNKNAQVIVATHSPEIAAGYKDDIFDMEDVFSE